MGFRLGLRAGTLTQTDRAARTVLSLPIYPELTDRQVAYVAARLRDILRA